MDRGLNSNYCIFLQTAKFSPCIVINLALKSAKKELRKNQRHSLSKEHCSTLVIYTSQHPDGRSCAADQETTADQNSVQNKSVSDNSAVDYSTVTAPTGSDTGDAAVLDLPLAVDSIRESPSITDSMPLEDNDIGHLPGSHNWAIRSGCA